MSKNNKTIASQAILEMKELRSAIKSESTNTIKALLEDVVKTSLREGIESDDYEIIEGKKAPNDMCDEDDELAQNDVDGAEGEQAAEDVPQDTEDAVDAGESAEVASDDEEIDTTPYQVGGDQNTLDLTGEKDLEKVAKVYKLLKDGDQVVLKTNSNGQVELKDNETGAEYVIDLGTDGGEVDNQVEDNAEETQLDEEFEFDFEDESEPYTEDTFDDGDGEENEGLLSQEDESGEDDGDELIINLISSEEDNDANYDDFVNDEEFLSPEGSLNLHESEKKSKKCMNNKETIYEIDLGYTDNYQDKDPIAGLKMDGETSFDAGLPKAKTEKPFSKLKQKQEPFVNEEDEVVETGTEEEQIEEAATSKSKRDRRHTTKTRSTGSNEVDPEVTKVHSKKGVNESIRKIEKENAELRKAIGELKENLREAYITNVNLGKITKLFLENTTSHKEKVEIVNRFVNEAKTIQQSNALYESINNQLKSASKPAPVTEQTISASASTINEVKIYESADLLRTKDFMKRMQIC